MYAPLRLPLVFTSSLLRVATLFRYNLRVYSQSLNGINAHITISSSKGSSNVCKSVPSGFSPTWISAVFTSYPLRFREDRLQTHCMGILARELNRMPSPGSTFISLYGTPLQCIRILDANCGAMESEAVNAECLFSVQKFTFKYNPIYRMCPRVWIIVLCSDAEEFVPNISIPCLIQTLEVPSTLHLSGFLQKA